MQVRVVNIPGNLESKQDLFSFFSGELQFPNYFSNNWDSFDEIINDLSWIDENRIEILHVDLPLRSSPKDYRIYLDILIDALVSSQKICRVSFEKNDRVASGA